MITAAEITKKREQEFKATFNFPVFDEYIENYFVRDEMNNLYIGLESRDYLKLHPEYLACDDLSLNPNGRHYIWGSSIQISHEVTPFVEKYLHEHGFKTVKKGACGYDYYDVMVVSL